MTGSQTHPMEVRAIGQKVIRDYKQVDWKKL